jgi:hypothetical protein
MRTPSAQRKERLKLVRSLPSRPDHVQLKLQAKQLKREHKARKPTAAARIAANHPRRRGQPFSMILDSPLNVTGAQLVVAREYGFESWAKLQDRVERDSVLRSLSPSAFR